MKEIKWKFPVAFVTIFLLVYQSSPFLGFSDDLIVAMFVTLPLLTIWMVYSVLKHGEMSNKTFEEGYFYDDLGNDEYP